jgi:hypothetical protein
LKGKESAIVGGILQLGNCLDLLDTDHTRRLAQFAKGLVERGATVPANVGTIRRGDCFLVNRYCESCAEQGAPFDTVRGLFQEGDPLIAGSEIRLENHIQVVVRRPPAIVGLFRPRGFTAWGAPVAPEHDVGQAESNG